LPDPVECEGAPRDLGRELGAADRDAPRAAIAACGGASRLRDVLGFGGPRLSRWERDLRRYFPHQHEWLEGAARALGVPRSALLRAALAALESGGDALLIGLERAGAPLLARTPAPDAALRRVRPEGRFASIELASPVLSTPWIGVNEAGLAVAVGGGRRSGRFHVHAALLARDCLERFEAVESALAWCLGRPAAPGAGILLADAAGELAGVELSDAGRCVRRPEGGVLVLGGAPGAELAKSLAGGASRDLDAALGRVLGESAARGSARIDVAERRLRAAAGARPESI
jgi:hypothetical protein